jgi:aminocarboxymuconate-semialdehyde decarboxylase
MERKMSLINSERPIVVDFHAHMLDEAMFDLAIGHNVVTGFGARQMPKTAPRTMCMLDPVKQTEDMDRRGIDMHVISSSQVIVGTWWAQADVARDLVRRQNDRAAEWVTRFPGRFVGAFDLPLQNMEMALVELERATENLGLKVANLPAGVGQDYLGAPQFHELWADLERRNITCFIHPDGVKDAWYQSFGMWNSIGQSIEETKVMASIIYNGIFEKFPLLKIVMAHGGGFLPHYMGRMDRNVTNMPHSMVNITRAPSEYLRNFYYDSCVYDPRVLKSLKSVVGADRIVMGGDYPVGNDPLAFIDEADALTANERSIVVGTTAANLLGISTVVQG